MSDNTDQIHFTSKLSGLFDREVDFNSTFPDHIDSLSLKHPCPLFHGRYPTQRDHQLKVINKMHASDLSSSSRLRGWGSAASRSSYACITSLVSMSLVPARQSKPIVGEVWGYFVDTNNHS